LETNPQQVNVDEVREKVRTTMIYTHMFQRGGHVNLAVLW
jgi:hypothetical protein